MKQRNLEEISLIRPILVILLITYHAFAPWNGAWSEFEGYIDIPLYQVIANLSYSFMLPLFVMISGYVWGYQSEVLQKHETIKKVILKKIHRLIIPSVFFSFFYKVIFKPYTQGISLFGGVTIWALYMIFSME